MAPSNASTIQRSGADAAQPYSSEQIRENSNTRAILDISQDYPVPLASPEPKPPKLDLLLKAQALAAQKNKQKLKNFQCQPSTSIINHQRKLSAYASPKSQKQRPKRGHKTRGATTSIWINNITGNVNINLAAPVASPERSTSNQKARSTTKVHAPRNQRQAE